MIALTFPEKYSSGSVVAPLRRRSSTFIVDGQAQDRHRSARGYEAVNSTSKCPRCNRSSIGCIRLRLKCKSYKLIFTAPVLCPRDFAPSSLTWKLLFNGEVSGFLGES